MVTLRQLITQKILPTQESSRMGSMKVVLNFELIMKLPYRKNSTDFPTDAKRLYCIFR